MEKKLLFEEGAFALWRHSGLTDEARAFLQHIAWGQSGPVYNHRNTEERIGHLHRPTLISITRQGKMLGTAVFCNTPVTAGERRYNSYYIRYFAASKEIRGQGIMKRYAEKVMTAIRDQEQEKTVFFAFVEKENKASYTSVRNAGYEQIGLLKTHGFSRFFPRKNKDIEQVATGPVRQELEGLLQQQYTQHALVQFNSIFLNNNYYVIREKGKVVAGCQYHRVHWVVNQMPGLFGKIVMKVVPLVPVLNKLFHPKKFEFLAFEGIFAAPGSESRLFELFEGLLAKEKLKGAMYWMDENCPVRKRLEGRGRKGLLHAFVRDSEALIMASFTHLNETEIMDIQARPLYVSAFDFI
ncbi:GNAT family N-acetyltransferase [Paraflavisolibacter sp. H34]|uniref:GNAT family N-acetyltransferase n=1 Tax=Huijunlia imazamoxiresistens TaxID=3127457 RepID=UPI003018EF63